MWELTPTDGVEFVNQTDANSQNPEIQFNKEGKYSIQLKAQFVNAQNQVVNEHSVLKKEIIEIKGVYLPVNQAKGTLNHTNGEVALSWERPVILPLYAEDFENTKGTMPSDFTTIDANKDGHTWGVQSSGAGNSQYSIRTIALAAGRPITANDYLVTGKIKQGAEKLNFKAKTIGKMRLDVYLVKDTGASLTLSDIQNSGIKIYSNSNLRSSTYTQISQDIKNHTDKDFYIVFHNLTRNSDFGTELRVDDIEIGHHISSSGKMKGEEKTILGSIDAPRLQGYEIYKNGQKIQDIAQISQLTHQDYLTQKGIYTYEIYALYSDGKKSESKIIEIDASRLSTTEVQNQVLRVYPNPSNGEFIIESKANVNSISAQVFDISGKEILNQIFKGNKAKINLSKYPKGTYILHLIENGVEKKSLKLIVK